MRPQIIDWETGIEGIGRIVVPSYFFMLALAFAVGFVLIRRESRSVGLDQEKMTDLGIYIVIFSLIGARLGHVLFDGMLTDYINLCLNPEAVEAVGLETRRCISDADCKLGASQYVCSLATRHCHPPRDCLAAFRAWQGGLTYYGGFLLGFLCAYVYVRRHGVSWGPVLDMYGFLLPLGLTFGRIGCYLNGCCFGEVTDLPWGARFPASSPASWQQYEAGLLASRTMPSLPVHPTELYHALANLAVFFVVYSWVRPKKRFHGQVMIAFLGLYCVGRFSVEFLRADQRGGLGPFSTSQLISIGVAGLAGLLYWSLSGRAGSVSEDR
jgi:phosphatidylglycerol:prolipoprotein diacylglycerol transferase